MLYYGMKQFDIPHKYKSSLIQQLKNQPKKKDGVRNFNPTCWTVKHITFKVARHFGFCYGVENAVEIAYKTIQNNPGKRIFLLSEMIHNPIVNADLKAHGIQFIQQTDGTQLIDWSEIKKGDIVLIPAFGTTIETKKILTQKGIEYDTFDTTCPFVELVWKRSKQMAKNNATTIIHGKPNHEETRATFSNASQHGPAIIVENMHEAKILGEFILNSTEANHFNSIFKNRCSDNFNVAIHLRRIGVVNQTTMLAEETQAIADYLKSVMTQKYGTENLSNHFEDTRDTLCYATNDNQQAIKSLLQEQGDIALIIGGYNSSNTAHLVELAQEVLPTYFIQDENAISSTGDLTHFDLATKQFITSKSVITPSKKQTILISSGASCPDRILENIILKIGNMFGVSEKELTNSLT